MQRRNAKQHGLYLIDFDRVTLPMVGRARFAFRYGRFDDETVGSTTGSQVWDSDADTLTIPDLRTCEVRIQAAPMVEDNSTPEWRTVWWGIVDYQEDAGWPGAQIPAGERIYHCIDGLARTTRWILDKHAFDNFGVVYGHPGYNTYQKNASRKLGNKGTGTVSQDGATIKCHTRAGVGALWTDKEVVENAIAIVRPPGEPLFTCQGHTGTLDGSHAWDSKPGETVLEFLSRACRRERGIGSVFCDWDDDSGAPSGPLTCKLSVYPQTFSDITYADPTSSTVDLPGADTEATTISVDLIGDHRLAEASYELGAPEQWRYDFVESLGEQIEVATTQSYQDGLSGNDSSTLARRWSDEHTTTFTTELTSEQRQEIRHSVVYQYHGLPLNWEGYGGNGNGTTTRVDYRCNDAGEIVVPDSSSEKTSPVLTEMLGDLPLLNAYNYAVNPPTRIDELTETEDQARRQHFVLVRVGDDRYLETDWLPGGIQTRLDQNGIWIIAGRDQQNIDGIRYFSDPDNADLNAAYDYKQLVVCCGLRLPHRARMASYAEGKSAANAKRRAVIYHDNLHLWLAAPGAIWQLDKDDGSRGEGYAGMRGAAGASGTTPGKLRDDRAELARRHALACAWYLTFRRTASWAIRDFGLFDTFDAVQGSSTFVSGSEGPVAYPKLGWVVNTLKANGEEHVVQTPVVRIHYDNMSGLTSWETGWQSLDFMI
jgi:hypothetical protein